jgi:Na+(H+)/acetate symporter ActP
MNKKGVEELLMNVIYLVIVGLILAMFTVWLGGLATGKLTKAQMLSKEIALIVDAAEPNTFITINHENGNLTLNERAKEITANIGGNEFSYDYFSKYKVSLQKINSTSTIIRVER